MSYEKEKRILLTGGGTGGSTSPLLAIHETWNTKYGEGEMMKYKFLWIGTRYGVERQMVEDAGIKFKAIASGKLRRYFCWQNFTDLFLIATGFFQALLIIKKYKPDLVMSAGSFVSVPVVWAAWLCRVPVLIHQQDARPGLANKLMAPFARKITVTFAKSLDHYNKKAVWIGNPVRAEIGNWKPVRPCLPAGTAAGGLEISKIKREFGITEDMPVVLIIGGGTGALAINELVADSLNSLTRQCQIIHITGKHKDVRHPRGCRTSGNYHAYEFFNAEQMAQAYGVANIVISRCGMGVLTEISYLGKPAILIPIPNSHQENNAEIFDKAQAALVLNQNELTAKKFTAEIKKLLTNKELRNKLRNNIKTVMKPGANNRMVEVIDQIIL